MALDAKHGAIAGETAQQWHDVREGSHVGGLFLDPDNFVSVGMLIECCLELFFGPRIQLLEEDDADGEVFALFALDAEVVSDLSGADEEAARVLHVVVGEHVLEVIECEVGDGGGCVGVTQHALGGEDDERLAP